MKQAVEAHKEPLIVRLWTEHQWDPLKQKDPVGVDQPVVPLAVARPVLGAPLILELPKVRQLHAEPKQVKPPL